MRHRFRRLFVLAPLILLTAAAATLVSRFSPVGFATEDRNGDGRPDVWRTYDRQGRLTEVAIDTNFDGRSDVHEYYEDGTLVSRESDRNFDDRIDLVQQFDAMTHDPIRTVEDVDFDGRADLLILFQSGRPVYSRWAPSSPVPVTPFPSVPSAQAPRRAGDDQLARFNDPFADDLAVRALRQSPETRDCLGCSASGWLPVVALDAAEALSSPSALPLQADRHASSAIANSRVPRGPPRLNS